MPKTGKQALYFYKLLALYTLIIARFYQIFLLVFKIYVSLYLFQLRTGLYANSL